MKRENAALQNLRHSFAHLLAAAVTTMYPKAKPTIGPSTDDGFYYDFDFGDVKISEPDLKDIEKKMESIVQKWKSFDRQEVTPDQARQIFANNPYKIELINELEENNKKAVIAGEETSPLLQHDGPKSSSEKDSKTAGHIYTPITLYTSGSFTDLCRGGHINDASKVMRHFKLMSIAGAYWRGSEKNKMLTRIYGTAFATKEELDAYLKMLEEAKKRDHRKIGADMELFYIDEMVGKGLVMWLPKGTILRDQIEQLAKKKEKEYGYVRVVTPHIAKEELYLQSGHLPYYKESMYPPMIMDDGTYYLKAMNCPHHHRIYSQKPKSYRELPLRIAEYGTCYRNELSGTLAGLLRVRSMAMNDAHIYCRKDQIESEFTAVLKMTQEYFEIFQLENYWFRLSKWDPNNKGKYIDEPENWEFSEQILRKVLQDLGLPFKEVENEAAFYGPKVDVQFTSAIGREETMSTIQLDFAAKTRFGLSYTDSEGKDNGDVFVIHRAPLSVHERFTAFLIEHYAGAFPLWLAPVQISLLPIAERHFEYARKVANELVSKGIRAEVDESSRTIGAKIRYQTLQKVPYMGIIGDKEIESSSVSIRSRIGLDHSVMNIDALTQKFVTEIENHT